MDGADDSLSSLAEFLQEAHNGIGALRVQAGSGLVQEQ